MWHALNSHHFPKVRKSRTTNSQKNPMLSDAWHARLWTLFVPSSSWRWCFNSNTLRTFQLYENLSSNASAQGGLGNFAIRFYISKKLDEISKYTVRRAGFGSNASSPNLQMLDIVFWSRTVLSLHRHRGRFVSTCMFEWRAHQSHGFPVRTALASPFRDKMLQSRLSSLAHPLCGTLDDVQHPVTLQDGCSCLDSGTVAFTGTSAAPGQ